MSKGKKVQTSICHICLVGRGQHHTSGCVEIRETLGRLRGAIGARIDEFNALRARFSEKEVKIAALQRELEQERKRLDAVEKGGWTVALWRPSEYRTNGEWTANPERRTVRGGWGLLFTGNDDLENGNYATVREAIDAAIAQAEGGRDETEVS